LQLGNQVAILAALPFKQAEHCMKQLWTIIWDWNGTLLNDVKECLQIINKSLHKRNLPALNLPRYLEKFQFPVKKYYEAIGFNK
jgi:phosphoglycolate phosphatase